MFYNLNVAYKVEALYFRMYVLIRVIFTLSIFCFTSKSIVSLYRFITIHILNKLKTIRKKVYIHLYSFFFITFKSNNLKNQKF